MGKTLNEIYQSIINASNAKTGKADPSVTEAVRTLIKGYGTGSGGGSGIIDVDKLPTENIDENAVYRVSGDGVDLYLLMPDGRGYLSDIFGSQEWGATVQYYVVEELPEVTKPSSEFDVHIYILKDNGWAYWDLGDGAQLISGDGMYQMRWATPEEVNALDQADPTNHGVYAVEISSNTLYIYHDGSWVSYKDEEAVDRVVEVAVQIAVGDTIADMNEVIEAMDKVIDVEELPTEDIKENCIYRVPTPAVDAYVVGEGVNAPAGTMGIAPLHLFLAIWWAIGGGSVVEKARYVLVNELPETGWLVRGDTMYMYVTEADGIPYLFNNGAFVPLTEVFAGLNMDNFHYVNYQPTTNDAEGIYVCKKTVYKYFKFMGNKFVELSNVDDVRGDCEDEANEKYYNLIDKSITTVDVGDVLTSIGAFAFTMCHDLQTVRIGKAVASIGESAFWECTSLKTVYICRNNEWPDTGMYNMTIAPDAFLSCTALTDIYVPWAEDHNEYWKECYGDYAGYVTPASEWAPINATVHYNYKGE